MDHAYYPLFAPGISEEPVGLLPFCTLFIICPSCTCYVVIFSPLQFLCILLLEETFVQVHALLYRVPGPRPQPVLMRWMNLLTGFIAANCVQLPAIVDTSDQDSKESAYNAGSLRFHLWVGKIPWRRKWQPTSIFLPGESYGQRRLAGYSPWGRKSRTQLSDQTNQPTNQPTIWSGMIYIIQKNVSIYNICTLVEF